MAAALLDTIINDTIHQTLRNSDLYEDSLLKRLQQINSAPATRPADTNNEQIDNLTQLLQNIEMTHLERIFWIVFFFIMVLVAAGGNVIVIYIVSTNKEMKSVTNYFLVNLSLADTMVSTLNVIFNFISMLNSHWPFGKVYCKISNFIAILSIAASVFTLTAISCDRYNAIIHPLRPRMSHSHAIGWILLIWTLSSLLALPNAIYSTLVEDRLINDNFATTCTMIWPDGRYPLSSYDHIYNIILLVVTYLVPIITMAILYYKVGKELWGYEAIGENVDKQHRAILAKKKIVKMMIVVVIIFALCWLPYHAFFVVNYYLPTIFQDAPLYYQRCYLIMYWLAMSNSMYNPIIIYFMNSKFRQEFRRVLYFICCCRSYSPHPARSDASATAAGIINNNNNNRNCAQTKPHCSFVDETRRTDSSKITNGERQAASQTKTVTEADVHSCYGDQKIKNDIRTVTSRRSDGNSNFDDKPPNCGAEKNLNKYSNVIAVREEREPIIASASLCKTNNETYVSDFATSADQMLLDARNSQGPISGNTGRLEICTAENESLMSNIDTVWI